MTRLTGGERVVAPCAPRASATLAPAVERALAADGPTLSELPIAIDPPWEL